MVSYGLGGGGGWQEHGFVWFRGVGKGGRGGGGFFRHPAASTEKLCRSQMCCIRNYAQYMLHCKKTADKMTVSTLMIINNF